MNIFQLIRGMFGPSNASVIAAEQTKIERVTSKSVRRIQGAISNELQTIRAVAADLARRADQLTGTGALHTEVEAGLAAARKAIADAVGYVEAHI